MDRHPLGRDRRGGEEMTEYAAFLKQTGWGAAEQTPLAGDASARRYIRLCSGANRAILMIDPADDTDRFARISGHLIGCGLSAPIVRARAPGLMLLEDFGDAQFARVIAQDTVQEIPLYRAATDMLLHLEQVPVPDGLTQATPDLLGEMIAPAFTHYRPAMGGDVGLNDADLAPRLTGLLERHMPQRTVLVLRDNHAENLIWLPDRDGVRRVGLLDFQDALAGPPIYDLVSMLQDARRDVGDACRDAVLEHYLDHSGQEREAVLNAYHLLGVQRNLRILGVFARLAVERNKPTYLSLLPRVWSHIETSLTHPVAAPLASCVKAQLPAPTPDRLRALEARCRMP